MGLDGSTCSECLPERTCHFEPPEHVQRTSAGAQTCVWGPGGLPVCHAAESTRKDARPEEKKCRRVKKHIGCPGPYVWCSDASINTRKSPSVLRPVVVFLRACVD